MKKIKKAVIPAAGLGTRFLPATKAMPKEMLPIVDKPAIQYIVEEAIASGIEDIIIVTGRGKRAIEDHFDSHFELEQKLINNRKNALLQEVRKTSIDIHYIRQKEPLGLGHAVWCARKFVGDEPFALLLGDDIVYSEKPCIGQLMEQYNITTSPILGVQQVEKTQVDKYGIVEIENDSFGKLMNTYKVKNLIEKPNVAVAPSNLAIMGRYILTHDIFDILESAEVGVGGEIQLTDALQKLSKVRDIFSYEFVGRRYDVGDKLGFITSLIEFALRRDDLKKDLQVYLDSLRVHV